MQSTDRVAPLARSQWDTDGSSKRLARRGSLRTRYTQSSASCIHGQAFAKRGEREPTDALLVPGAVHSLRTLGFSCPVAAAVTPLTRPEAPFPPGIQRVVSETGGLSEAPLEACSIVLNSTFMKQSLTTCYTLRNVLGGSV